MRLGDALDETAGRIAILLCEAALPDDADALARRDGEAQPLVGPAAAAGIGEADVFG